MHHPGDDQPGLAMMAADLPWTRELGDAFVAERADVMDAVQRLRQQAHGYGYLHSTPQVVVTGGPYIEVRPVNTTAGQSTVGAIVADVAITAEMFIKAN